MKNFESASLARIYKNTLLGLGLDPQTAQLIFDRMSAPQNPKEFEELLEEADALVKELSE